MTTRDFSRSVGVASPIEQSAEPRTGRLAPRLTHHQLSLRCRRILHLACFVIHWHFFLLINKVPGSAVTEHTSTMSGGSRRLIDPACGRLELLSSYQNALVNGFKDCELELESRLCSQH